MEKAGMSVFIRTIDWICRIGGYLAAMCILLMTLLILVETSIRMAAGSSIFIAEEYSAYLMANFVMLGLAFTLREGGHIKVSLLLSKLGLKAKGSFRLAACLLGIMVFSFLT
ncbi:MAG: TRAP transporter small permease subunit, partial [Desulfarculaceae bacterium]